MRPLTTAMLLAPLLILNSSAVVQADAIQALEGELEECIANPPSFAEDEKNMNLALDNYFRDHPNEKAERWPKERVIDRYLQCLTACHSTLCSDNYELNAYNHFTLDEIRRFYQFRSVQNTTLAELARGLTLLELLTQTIGDPALLNAVPDTKQMRLKMTNYFYDVLPKVNELERAKVKRDYEACITECDEMSFPFYVLPPLTRFDDPLDR